MKGLTVGQLIKILKEHNPNQEVFYAENFTAAKAIGFVGIGGRFDERMVVLGGVPVDENTNS